MTRPIIQKLKPSRSDRVKGKKDRTPKVPKVDRKKLEKQVEEIAKLIICWRDGQTCVMGEMDGGRCGNGLMWNHFIRQKTSPWLRYDLGNIHWGCGNHNLLDNNGDKVMGIWFNKTFSADIAAALWREQIAHKGKRPSIADLQEMLERYDNLYQNRYTAPVGDLQAMIYKGYYGDVIRQVVFPDMKYNHEAYLVTSEIDFGKVSK